ncbi:MAG: 30S ribosomal protein S9 [Balneolales bacterium]
MAIQSNFIGRRKTSTARVYVQPGKGDIIINNKPLTEYFTLISHQNIINLPFRTTETEGKFDIKVNVKGGGTTGQADAVQLGIARALNSIDPELHTKLKTNNLLSRDDRMVERKKYGQPKARKQFQFSKR